MEFITIKRENAVACIEMNRPPANALAQALLKELAQAFGQLENDPETRVVLLYGKGRFFSAERILKNLSN